MSEIRCQRCGKCISSTTSLTFFGGGKKGGSSDASKPKEASNGKPSFFGSVKKAVSSDASKPKEASNGKPTSIFGSMKKAASSMLKPQPPSDGTQAEQKYCREKFQWEIKGKKYTCQTLINECYSKIDAVIAKIKGARAGDLEMFGGLFSLETIIYRPPSSMVARMLPGCLVVARQVRSEISKYARDKAASLPNDKKEFKDKLLAELHAYDSWDPWEGQKK